MFKKIFLILFLPLFLFSCEELNNVSEELKVLKENQDLLLKQQADLIKKIALLQTTVKNQGSNKTQPKKNTKRKTPNPNISHNIPIGNSVVLGNPNAKVTVTKFTDFQWPYCARSVDLIDDLLKKYPNDVKVVIKNFPLSSHKQARLAAQYALAAARQFKCGESKSESCYKDVYHKIFEDYRSLKSDPDLPVKIAAELGLDTEQLIADANAPEISQLIDTEFAQLTALRNAYPETDEYAAGVRMAVPKFFINGREPLGRDVNSFSAMIDEEIKK